MTGLELEESLKGDIVAAFPFLDGKVRVQRARRIWIEAPEVQFHEILGWMLEKAGVVTLCTITGQDAGEQITFWYHLARADGVVLNLGTQVPKSEAVIRTVTDTFPNAIFYERELVDLLGVTVLDLPSGNRYPLRDDWPAGHFPLRKDWNATMLPGEGKA
jgi:Ni,Fe-hydrogenase III component G